MAKTYNTISTFVAGNVLTAAEMNDIGENSNNYRVPPMCRVIPSGNQNHDTSGNWKTVAFAGVDEFDTDAMHDPASNNTRITAATAGVYLIAATLTFASNATGLRAARFLVNGSTVIANEARAAVNGDTTIISLSTLYELDVTDYVELQGFQNSTATVAMNLATTTMQAAWVGQVS